MNDGTLNPEPSLFWQVEHPAKRSLFRANEKDWPILVVNWPLSICDLLDACALDGSCGKMSAERCIQTEGETLEPSSGTWATSGMGGATECWMLDTLESPNPADESFSLRSIETVLEIGDIPQQHYLTNLSVTLLNLDRKKFPTKSFRIVSVRSDGAKVCRTTVLPMCKMPTESDFLL